MRKINRKSITIKLSILMLIVIFVQMLLMILGILFSGIMTDLKNNTYNLFEIKVENRKDYLETEMNMQYSKINSYATTIEAEYNLLSQNGTTLTEEETLDFLINIAPDIISMLKVTRSTGSFIILNDNEKSDSRSSIYILDEDPLFDNEFNEDIVMLKGPTEVSRELEIQLHSEWNYGITLDESNQNIFNVPFDTVAKIDYSEKLGYWDVSPSIAKISESIITYSIPLTNQDGDAFGVIGIEVTQDEIYRLLPNNEFVANSFLGYIIAIQDEETKEIMPVILEGTVQNSLIDSSKPLELELLNGTENIHKILNVKEDISIICNTQELKLYNNNSPFAKEKWILVGLVEQEALLNFTSFFMNTIILIMLVSVILCSFLVFLVGKSFAKPIIDLAKKVRTNDPQTIVALGRTGFSEIDELSLAIEGLNMRILDAIVKTDKIIDMVNLPLGTFEYKKNSHAIICSHMAKHLLDLEKMNDKTITSEVFFKKIDKIRENVEDEQNNIYIVNDNPKKWLKIVSIDNEDEVLGIVMDVTSEILENNAIKFERDYDSLTSLYNRAAFHRTVAEFFRKGIKDVAACVMFDLDNLKYINDTYGHDMGDNYIKLTAKILSEKLTGNCVVARMSGDEFYVFLHSFDSKEAIKAHLEKVYDGFKTEQLFLTNAKTIKIRMSGGISWYGEDSSNLEELLRFADFAMYQGKHTVKGEIREFNRESFEKESFMLSAREELNTILDNQLMDYVFQPIVSAKDGSLYGYEALMRPQSSVLSSPIKLLQIATAQSQLWKVEVITLFKTLALYKEHKSLFKDCKVFINSIPNECLRPSEIEEIEFLYSDFLGNIVIEITENEKLDDKVYKKKRKFAKKWGAKIALDDYGSGYNGDISLISIAPQIVKIDMLMIRGIETDKSRQSMIRKLILYAKEQNIIVLAEGVETYAQLDYLVHAGVDLFQGYYISRPIPLPNFDNTIIVKEIEEIFKQI